MKRYKFALSDIMKDLKIENPNQLSKKYFSDGRISKQALYKLCQDPTQIKFETLNILCDALGLDPSALWRLE